MHRTTQRATFRLRLQRWLPAVLAMALLLAACSSGGESREPGGEPATIKVMFWNDQSFQQDYGMLFSALHPEIEIVVADTTKIRVSGNDDYDAKWEEFVREEKPDVLMLSQDQYEKFAADGRLVSLESYMTRDKLDAEGFIPGLIDMLRETGDGELYGLAPHFSSQAIYYNKDLFDRFGIDYPTDKMSWEELLNLAARFPTDGSEEDRIYGLSLGYMGDLFQFGQRIGMSMGLRLVNPADKRLLVDSESWVRVYEMAHKALQSGTIHRDDRSGFSGNYEEYLLSIPFIGGKAAMVIEGTFLMQQIREAADVIPDKAVKNWDLVTVPVDPSNPDYSHDASVSYIFAINAESANRDAAWAFIRYIHSDEYARVRSKTFNGQFPVRTKYIRDEEGRNMAAFYALKPSGADLYAGVEDLPDNFFMQYHTIGMEEFQAVTEDRKTVAEALASLQTRLQAALDEAAANPEGDQNAAEAPVSIEFVRTITNGEESVPAETETETSGEGAAE